MQVSITVNGVEHTDEVEPRLLLVHYLRDTLRLTGTHWGCDTSQCGTCVAWLDEEPVKTCTVLAAMADGHRVRTVEGLALGGKLDPVQEGFMSEHGLQCGFCTPGMLVTAVDLVQRRPDATDDEIRLELCGNLCRCTGYVNIVAAIRAAAGAA
jgi:carbon-monoxide dehydrogenase small subunit